MQSPTFTALKRTTQIVNFYDDIDDTEYSSGTETSESSAVEQPLSEKYPVLFHTDSMEVPISLMRMIEHELREGNYDLRTVLNDCCGMVKGTSEFNDAYIAARILSQSRFKKHSANG